MRIGSQRGWSEISWNSWEEMEDMVKVKDMDESMIHRERM